MASFPSVFSPLGFSTLSFFVYYSSGESPSVTEQVAVPVLPAQPDGINYDLIILCGWWNAPARPLTKFVHLHRSLQPGVPILLLRSTTSSFFPFAYAFQESLPLVHEVIKKLQTEGKEHPKILVHTFSNGGTGGFTKFLTHYRRESGNAMPIPAMIIDSAPGWTKFPDSLHRGVAAFMASAPKNPVVRAILLPMMYTLFSVLYVVPYFMGLGNPIDSMRDALNDETLVSDGGTRGYIYSKGDKLVDFNAIASHAEQAEERGWKVTTKVFEGGEHVAGYRDHPQEYTQFVKEIRKAGA